MGNARVEPYFPHQAHSFHRSLNELSMAHIDTRNFRKHNKEYTSAPTSKNHTKPLHMENEVYTTAVNLVDKHTTFRKLSFKVSESYSIEGRKFLKVKQLR